MLIQLEGAAHAQRHCCKKLLSISVYVHTVIVLSRYISLCNEKVLRFSTDPY